MSSTVPNGKVLLIARLVDGGLCNITELATISNNNNYKWDRINRKVKLKKGLQDEDFKSKCVVCKDTIFINK